MGEREEKRERERLIHVMYTFIVRYIRIDICHPFTVVSKWFCSSVIASITDLSIHIL